MLREEFAITARDVINNLVIYLQIFYTFYKNLIVKLRKSKQKNFHFELAKMMFKLCYVISYKTWTKVVTSMCSSCVIYCC